MEYTIRRIREQKELVNCEEFTVSCYNWGGDYRPQTTGKLAYLLGEGFLLRMKVMEKNPTCLYKDNDDPVYKDSAVEAFINFYPENPGAGYINFEINSRGAMLVQYGENRLNRKFVADMGLSLPLCKALREEEFWQAELFIPLAFIFEVYQQRDFQEASGLRCNFFKIKEGGSLEHYASYAPISSDSPNFHLPQYFRTCPISDLD